MPKMRKVTGRETTTDDYSTPPSLSLTNDWVVITDELPKLPSGWMWTTLGRIATLTRCRENPQEHPNLQYIGLEHLESHTMRLLGTAPANEMRSSAEHFWPDDVLYGRLRPYLNKVFRPDFEGLCSAEFIVFRRNSHLSSKYLQYFLNSWDFVTFATHLNAGDRPRVDFEQIEDYLFPLPPLAEQHRIVAAIEQQLTRIDAGVAALKAAQAKLRRYRAAVLKAACEGRLVPQDPSDEPARVLLQRILDERRVRWEAEQIAKMQARGRMVLDDGWREKYREPQGPDMTGLPELPEGWMWATGEQLTIKIVDGTHHTPKYLPNGVPFISVKDVRNGRIFFEDCKYISEEEHKQLIQRCYPERDDVVITKSGTIGRVAVIRVDTPFSLFVSVALLKTCKDNLDQDFFKLALEYYIQGINIQQSVKGGLIKNLHLEDIRIIPLRLPPLTEQQRIVAEVERRLSVVAEVEGTVAANLRRAERLRQAVLRQAFAGKLVPQDPSDEPASVLLERIRQHREPNTEPRAGGKRQRARKQHERQLPMDGIE